MEKFLKCTDSAKPGRKRKPAETCSKDYEKKRVRFQPHWALTREWLKYENEKMICSYCQESGDIQNPFVNGCTNFKIEALTSHESTKAHTTAVQKVQRQKVQMSNTVAGQTLIRMKESERAKMNILFRNAHFVAKHNLSFRTFTALCKLDKSKGIEVGDTYLNDKSCALFTKHIADTEHIKTKDLFKNSPFVSVTCDGTSDYTGDEYESLFLRSSIHGKVTDRFVSVGTTTTSAGKDIFTHIDTCLGELAGDDYNYWHQVCGFCSEGASNMQGKHKGVAAFVRQKNPETCIMHCMAHRVELAYKDAVKKIRLYDKAITLLMGFYYLYRKSPKLKQELKNSFKALNKKVVLSTRIGGTRWLPHISRAITVFLKGYMAFRLHLEASSHNNAKAEGLAKLLLDSSVVVFILDLKVILAPLMKLSLMLQEKCSSLADSHFALQATCDVLDHMKTSMDEEVKDVFTSKMYQGEKLTGTPSTGYHETMIENLLQCLNDRFPMTEVVKACEIMCLKNWSRKQQSIGFGNEAVKTIFQHFQKTLHQGGLTADCSADEIIQQWVFMKSFMYSKYGDTGLAKLSWEDVLSALPEEYANIKLLFDLLLSLPATSVNNETCFSLAKLTKTKRRGHLQTSRLSDLLSLEISSPSIQEFDPTEAINHWMVTASGGRRKVCYVRHKVLLEQAADNEVELNTNGLLIATKITDGDMPTEDENGQTTESPPLCETETLQSGQPVQIQQQSLEQDPVAGPSNEGFIEEAHADKDDDDDSSLSDDQPDSDYESGDDSEITEEGVMENLRRFV